MENALTFRNSQLLGVERKMQIVPPSRLAGIPSSAAGYAAGGRPATKAQPSVIPARPFSAPRVNRKGLVPQIQACAEEGLGTGSYRSYACAMISLAKRTIEKYETVAASGACPPSTSVEFQSLAWRGGKRLFRLEEVVIFKVTVEECAARARTPIELGFEFWKQGLARVH
jgi:hypothetical protein